MFMYLLFMSIPSSPWVKVKCAQRSRSEGMAVNFCVTCLFPRLLIKCYAFLCLQGIVGNLSSGKSALVHRYLTGTYVQEESPEGEDNNRGTRQLS